MYVYNTASVPSACLDCSYISAPQQPPPHPLENMVDFCSVNPCVGGESSNKSKYMQLQRREDVTDGGEIVFTDRLHPVASSKCQSRWLIHTEALTGRTPSVDRWQILSLNYKNTLSIILFLSAEIRRLEYKAVKVCRLSDVPLLWKVTWITGWCSQSRSVHLNTTRSLWMLLCLSKAVIMHHNILYNIITLTWYITSLQEFLQSDFLFCSILSHAAQHQFYTCKHVYVSGNQTEPNMWL